jgi:hypothetical protein
VDCNGLAEHLTRSECEDFKLHYISNALDGNVDDMLRKCSEDGNVKSTRKTKAPTAKMERVTTIDKGR